MLLLNMDTKKGEVVWNLHNILSLIHSIIHDFKDFFLKIESL